MKLLTLYIAATARINRDITLGPGGPVVPFFPSSPDSPYQRKVRKLMTYNHRAKSKNLSTVLSEVQPILRHKSPINFYEKDCPSGNIGKLL